MTNKSEDIKYEVSRCRGVLACYSPVVVQDQLPDHVAQICRLGVLRVGPFLAGMFAGAGKPQQVENVGWEVALTHL